MAVPHYAYLLLKMPGPKGVITVKGNFQKSDSCDREFSKISETFGMEAALPDLAVSNDSTLMLEQKKMAADRSSTPPMTQSHIRCTRPIYPRQSISLRVCLSHKKARSSNSTVRTWIYLQGVQLIGKVFPRNLLSTLSNCFQILNLSSKQRSASLARKDRNRSRSQQITRSRFHQRNQEITVGGQPRTFRK